MGKTSYAGIDYGMGATNIDRSVAPPIRFGVISQNEVLEAWAESSEAIYPDEVEGQECPNCGEREYSGKVGEVIKCTSCGEEFELDLGDFVEPLGFVVKTYYGDASGKESSRVCLFAHCGEDGDIFVEKSPYYTYAQFCSPCAPGACYLMSWLEKGAEGPFQAGETVAGAVLRSRSLQNNKCYCLGHDWFEGGRAPYPVYSVETDEPIEPEPA